MREHVARGRRQPRLVFALARLEEPAEVLAAEERDGHRPGEPASGMARALVTLETAPGDLAREAELVEPGGLVAAHARRQHFPLPACRGQLEALELLDDARQALAAMKLQPRLDVLPREEEAHEIGRAHRLDFSPEPVEGTPVNAGQEPPVAPF